MSRAPLEDLREHVRGLLAGEVHPAELGDRVVAVLAEDPRVQLLGPPQPDGGVEARVPRHVELLDELVEEEPAQALGRARVAGEQGALDDLGQVDEREHGAVEIGEVAAEELPLLGGEVLSACDRHARTRLRGGLPTGADGAALDRDRHHRRGGDHVAQQALGRRPGAFGRLGLGATTATWRSRSMTCFTLRTKSPPDMSGAALRPRRPDAGGRLQHLAQVAAPAPSRR